jgi:uncharacterized membrane protein
MKRKILLVIASLFLCITASFANNENNGEKKNKAEPDMTGNITHAETGKPLKDVIVTAYNTTKKEKVVLSDGSGNFSLADLKPGTYKFTFEKDGYRKYTRDKVTLKTNEDYLLNIELNEDEEVFDMIPSTLHFSGSIR